MADRARRNTGCRAQPPGSEGAKHSPHGPDDVQHRDPGHQDVGHRGRRKRHHDSGSSARRDAPCLRQDDRQRSRRGLYACSANGLADDLHSQRQAVHRCGRQRRALFRRIHRLHASVHGGMSASPRECSIRKEGDDHAMMKYPAAVLVLASLASPLWLLRAQAPEAESRSVWDGVYTEDQAKRGETIYQKECAACHGAMLTGGDSAQLAGLDALLSSFVEERVHFGLKIFLLSLQSAHLHFDRLALVSLVEFDAAGGRRWFTFTEFLQVNELLVNIGDLSLQLLQ